MAVTLSGITSLVAKAEHTFQVMKSVYTKNSMGAFSNVLTPIDTPLTCWIQQATENDSIFWGQRGIKMTHKCYFDSDPGVKQGDVGIMGGTVPSFISGMKLIVRGFDDQGGLGELVVLILEELKDGQGTS